MGVKAFIEKGKVKFPGSLETKKAQKKDEQAPKMLGNLFGDDEPHFL